MKAITILFLFASVVYGQGTIKPSLKLEMKFSLDGNEVHNDFNENNVSDISGFVTYCKENNRFTFTTTPEYFLFRNVKSIPNLINNKADLTIHFNLSFDWNNSSNNLIKTVCKYYIYEKQNSSINDKDKYTVSYNETDLNLPLDKEVSLDIFTDIFPYAKNVILLNSDKDATYTRKYNHGMKSYLSFKGLSRADSSILHSINESTVKRTPFKIDAGFFITDKTGKEISIKKFNYPLPSDTCLYIYPKIRTFPINIYRGIMTDHFSIYNPKLIYLYRESEEYKDSRIEDEIALIPISQKGNIITFDLFWGRQVWYSHSVYTKRFQVELNKPQKISMEGFDKFLKRTIEKDGKYFQFGLEDYSDYVNEYLIITVNSDK